MGSVYRETYTKPLPANAEFFTLKGERFARWKPATGRTRTAKVTNAKDGTSRIIVKAKTFTAKYRDGSRFLVKVSTGCRSKEGARAVLAELEKRAENVHARITTAAEDSVLDHQTTPIGAHISAYLEYLRHKRGKGGKPRVSPKHIANVKHRLIQLAEWCNFKLLRDLNRKPVDRWVKAELESQSPLSARTINDYLSTLSAMGNWCVETGRLVANPFFRLGQLDAKSSRRRQRRALTGSELLQLLRVAFLRPLAEIGRKTVILSPDQRTGRKTWKKEPLSLMSLDGAAERAREVLAEKRDRIIKLEELGRERALIYKALVLTGLRKGELASLTVGQVEFDGPTAYLTVHAADEKAGRGADIPLRADLAADLRQWLAGRLEVARDEERAAGEPLLVKLPNDAKLFNVPSGLIRILNRDLAAAGIPKRDDRGYTVDVHAMRHTFGTHLSRGGVAPRTAQAAMRHSKIDLTMNVYTDPRLLDVAGALDVLPALPLDHSSHRAPARATGTDARNLVPMLVPTSGNHSTQEATADKTSRERGVPTQSINGHGVKSSERLSRDGKKRVMGLEPTTFTLAT